MSAPCRAPYLHPSPRCPAWCVVRSLTPSLSTPLNLAGGGGGNRLTVASTGSFYKTPRCNSIASSIHSTAGFNTDMTTADSVCHSPGVTGQSQWVVTGHCRSVTGRYGSASRHFARPDHLQRPSITDSTHLFRSDLRSELMTITFVVSHSSNGFRSGGIYASLLLFFISYCLFCNIVFACEKKQQFVFRHVFFYLVCRCPPTSDLV